MLSSALAVDLAGEVTDPVLEVKGVAVRTQLQYQPSSWRALGIPTQIYPLIKISVADPHHFKADLDPTFHFDTDPDPTFSGFDAEPDPTICFFPDLDPPILQNDPLRLQPFHSDADPDPAFHFDTDLDPHPTFHS